MNRETEVHFSNVPKIHQNRSIFNMSHSHKTAFNVGDIIPIYMDPDILPGDTVTMEMAEVVRMATPIFPVMDNMVLDIMFYFVPTRLIFEHWREFWGENENPWTQNVEYEIPQIKAPEGGFENGTIADYMGVPTYISNLEINALPFRAYAKVWNDWYRDQNLKSCCHIYTDETTRTGTNTGDYVINTELGAKPAKAAKLNDYFTSCLPEPQKGEPVALPLGTTANVYVGPTHAMNKPGITDKYTLEWGAYSLETGEQTGFTSEEYNVTVHGKSSDPYTADTRVNSTTSQHWPIGLAPNNLYADLTNATASTITELRQAFAVQKYYEMLGRGGSRYIEWVRNIFGVESSDARMQRSEYLGGQRIPIQMEQIIQTSSTDTTTPQGNASGFSCTIGKEFLFQKSFEEHGILLGLAVARVPHSYQNGLDRGWTRKKWTDFYNPFFANLSEQAVRNDQIYASANLEVNEQAFGYQEAWADYRYKNSRVSSSFRSNTPGGSLDAWHYADDYETRPTLSSEWIDETKSNVDRTLAVTSELENQLIGDFYFKAHYTRCMPVYSIPGLIDHV